VTRFDTDALLPPDPEGMDVLHDRDYWVRAYRKADDVLLLRGAVCDRKPPGLYIPGDDGPLVLHHMQLDLEVRFPSMDIIDARVVFQMHPREMCPGIADHYRSLIGLSIARGFTHKVRELFGGPRGCSHTTALLQAMAPVAIQSTWSMTKSVRRRSDGERPEPPDPSVELAMNRNTCHVYADDSEYVSRVAAGDDMGIPVFLRRRLEELGRDVDDWQNQIRT
jgi:hypothetical protein